MNGEASLNKVIDSIVHTFAPDVTGDVRKRRVAFAILCYVSGRRDGNASASFLKAHGLKDQEISHFYVSLKEALRNEAERRAQRSVRDPKISMAGSVPLSSLRQIYNRLMFEIDMKKAIK